MRCGSRNNYCCDGLSCGNDGSVCMPSNGYSAGMCYHCGQLGESCCDDGTCSQGYCNHGYNFYYPNGQCLQQ